MAGPLANDYLEAIRHPSRCFQDQDLRRGTVAADIYAGSHAEVFNVRCSANRTRWAVKCYTQEVPGLARRYQALDELVSRSPLPWLLGCQYLERGICVRGRWQAMVKMPWVEGVNLRDFV